VFWKNRPSAAKQNERIKGCPFYIHNGEFFRDLFFLIFIPPNVLDACSVAPQRTSHSAAQLQSYPSLLAAATKTPAKTDEKRKGARFANFR
jgi:hypothetical protein